MSLSTGRSTPKEVDDALSGKNITAAKNRLRQFQAQVADELVKLNNRQKAAKSLCSQLKSRIAEIERAPLPVEPLAPYLAHASEENRRLLFEQHAQNMRRQRDELYQLRAEASAAEREADQLSLAIASRGGQAQAEERKFLEDVSEARDKDLLLELHRVLEKAAVAFRLEGN